MKDQRIEMVSGGWVTPDEGITNYYGLITQLFEGHELLKNVLGRSMCICAVILLRYPLGVKPVTQWAIDSFGHSSVVQYIYKQAGFKDVVLNRVNYWLKKALFISGNNNFYWRQAFAAGSNVTDVLAHLMPIYFSLDSCGPDKSVCTAIDHANETADDLEIQHLAVGLARNLRAKAEHARTRVILFSVGNDFVYNTREYWKAKHAVTHRITRFINDHFDEFRIKVGSKLLQPL